MENEPKHSSIAYLLWGLGFVGICGVHRMYLGQYNLGVAMLLTFGLCGVGQLIDVGTISKLVDDVNQENGFYSRSADSKEKASSQDRHLGNTHDEPSESSREPDDWDIEQESLNETLKRLKE